MNVLWKRASNLTLFGGLCLSIGVGCVTDNNSNPDDPSGCENLTNDDVSSGATLSNDSCYEINGGINVSSGTLVIEAGTTVFMGAGSSITLSGTGTLEALGEEDNEILIRGVDEERGYWAGIYINETGTSNHVLEYVTIRHAGGDQFTGSSDSKGAVYVRGESRLSVSNCAFEQNAFAGIHADDDGSTVTIETTSFTGNELPLRLRPNHFAALGGDLNISGNDADHILMTGGNATATNSGTWQAYTYRLPKDVTLEADVTIAAGATLEFAQDTRLAVNNDAGSLNIAGTEDAMVTLRSANGERGGWGGLYFNNAVSSSNAITYASLEDAGGAQNTGSSVSLGGIYVVGDDTRLTIANSTFVNNAFAAIHVESFTTKVSVSASHFENNEVPIIVHPDTIGNLAADLTFSENESNVIEVKDVSSNTVELVADATWPAFEVPLFVSTFIYIQGHLTLSPGTELIFATDVGLDVDGGSLTANAADADPIVMRGEEALSGFWMGIGFNGSYTADNQLINVELINAGSKRWTGNSDHQASLYIDGDSRVTVEDLTITGSGQHGIVVLTEGELVGCTGLNISGSAGEDFFGAVADATACLPL
ncbi:hypothetical protein DL240_10175 [Lujinxingia litoralis]|uniref:Right handed beta helix domain-containing protein n=1 Tax=Lujinxingia litoralis TaxID=2211119 RepID=A0A328C741_9DELT|nr:hypothetical protein [Lujinxingia litoralis]RAL22210.1 hypothetical protein DL240_10175 [Lujinxingia litoralis]